MVGRTAARRYAKALIELAKRDGLVEEIGAQLRQQRMVFQDNANLRQVLETPSVEAEVKSRILNAIFERTQPAPLLRNFLALLLEKDRLRQFDAVCQHYERMANEELQRVVAQVITANALEPEQQQAVIQKLTEITQKNIVLETRVDPSILGGLVVRLDHLVLDGSVRGQLARLRRELIGG